jgi:hypothetical protein
MPWDIDAASVLGFFTSQALLRKRCRILALGLSLTVLPANNRAKAEPATEHSFLTAGGWLIPGTSTLCPPASPHPQFGGPLSLPPTHGCERYPSLRNHRSSPYPNPYAHRNNSPSRFDCKLVGDGGWLRDPFWRGLLQGSRREGRPS